MEIQMYVMFDYIVQCVIFGFYQKNKYVFHVLVPPSGS